MIKAFLKWLLGPGGSYDTPRSIGPRPDFDALPIRDEEEY